MISHSLIIDDLDYFIHKILFTKDANIRNSKKQTQIFIDVPSNNFKHDLWIGDLPANVNLRFFMLNNNLLFFIIIIVLISTLSSLISAIICYRKFKPSKLFFFLLGLSNLLTLLGFIFFSFIFKVNKRFLKFEQQSIESQSSIPHGILIYSITFSAIFHLISLIIFSALYYI